MYIIRGRYIDLNNMMKENIIKEDGDSDGVSIHVLSYMSFGCRRVER